MEFEKKFLDILESADSLVFFTGAGISAESGISTFRGEDGLWKKFKPEELANFDAFLRNPELVWEWYKFRRDVVLNAEPNPGHKAIAGMEKLYDQVSVVTQNIDNLHRRAGSSNIFELHGNIEKNYCIECHSYFNSNELEYVNKIPRCNLCNGLVRPDVVWFGENLPHDIFSAAEKTAESSDICFLVGTSAIVYPAIYIPLSARETGATLVEINIEKTEISGEVNFCFTGKSGELLPQILQEAEKLKHG